MNGGRPAELVPVWPCPTADRIWFVPRVHIAGTLRCVVVQFEGQFRAIIIPADISLARLVQSARFLTGWDIGHIRVPPSLQARVRFTGQDFQLRDGDLLDALSPDDAGGRYIIRNPSDIKDHVLWSRSMVLQRATYVRLWTPDLRPPILTCLAAGTCWDPCALTFSGDFASSFPGRWVPAPWTPCRVPQLVLVAEEPETANVLYEDTSGVRCLNIDRHATPRELTEGSSDTGRGTRVLSMLSMGTHAPFCLRDGDVVVEGPLFRAEDSAWPDLHNAAFRIWTGLPRLWLGSCLPLSRPLQVACLLITSLPASLAVRTSGNEVDRSRSRSVEPATSRSASPRLGLWKPERRHPMGHVLSGSPCHFQVMCPFRGWGDVHTFSRTDEYAHFLRAVHQDAGTWATNYLPVGGESPGHFTTVLPLPPPPFAVVIVHSADSSRSVVMPVLSTLRKIADYFSAVLEGSGLRLHVPPALRRVEGYLDEPVRLRHGDTFELALGPWHPRVRRREALRVPSLECLPHLNLWHATIVIDKGGWVNVWGTSSHGISYCNRFWIQAGSLWSPTWLMFGHEGSSTSTHRWVPVPHLEEQEVSFVEQPEIDEAHVLLVHPYDVTATTCRRLLLAHGVHRDNVNFIPEGWQLRPDIEARVVKSWPRNGDVYIPQLAGRLFQSGVVTVSFAIGSRSVGARLLFLLTWATNFAAASPGALPVASRAPVPTSSWQGHGWGLLSLGSCLSCLNRRTTRFLFSWLGMWPCLAAGMFAPPLEQQQLAAVPVGKYPWRIVPHERALHESVLPCNPARLLSPFTGLGGEITLTPDTLVDEARISLSEEEPYWYREIIPLWPALWQQTLVFVPVPSGGELVCIAVVSPEWQLAVLLPRRADLEWVLAHLRRITPGPLVSIRPPPATQTAGQSARGAVDWRSGDVVLAFQQGGEGQAYEPPVFVSPEHVRLVHCALPLLVCRPGRQPSGTTMPPPVRWVAAEGAFTGRFREKFPGRWVPVPWAYIDSITLCQRSTQPEYCNIILERCAGASLTCECRTVATAATRYSLAQIAQVPQEHISLLGQGVDIDDIPPLRDGDIVHYVAPADASRGNSHALHSVIVGLLCGSSRWGCFLSALGWAGHLSWRAYLPPLRFGTLFAAAWRPTRDAVTPSSPCGARALNRPSAARCEDTGQLPALPPRRRRVLQEDRRASLPLFSDTALFHARGPRVQTVILARLQHYLPALGAPTWTKEADGWSLDLLPVLQLQASLHRFWWARTLRDGLPHKFPRAYHAAWGAFPKWAGGVPESILIATDGSGTRGGSWAFVVWGHFKGRWYRIGWDCMSLAATPWIGAQYAGIPSFLHSYSSELAALQAAAIWCCASLDAWQTCCGSRPASVTVVGDNDAAVQVAAGVGTATGAVAAGTRVLWQAAQARINTFFRHTHSHVGVMVNTLVDALAGLHRPCPLALLTDAGIPTPLDSALLELGPLLWLVPQATVRHGRPCLFLCDGAPTRPDTAPPPSEYSHSAADNSPPPAVTNQERTSTATVSAPVPLHVLTANVQTMKDAQCSIFNPSGHAARRQYLLHQVSSIPCDVLCVQEARSKAGRWGTGGWLSWRSGHLKGQYGCEVWVRPDIVTPALGLSDWRILASSPRILVVTCIDPRLPLTVCSAHAPHADRPSSEAAAFWHELRTAVLRAPSLRGLVLGIDANADFFAQDDAEDLVGPLLAVGEPDRNDLHLLEFCLQLGLGASPSVQNGPGWSWEHTSGIRKRLDHLLFQTGPWEVTSTGQALDLDLGHTAQDHMPLRARAILRCPAPASRRPRQRRWTPTEVVQHGAGIWHSVRSQLSLNSTPAHSLQILLRCYADRVKGLPRRPPLQPRQPYISQSTVQTLIDLRDWRQQLRRVARAHQHCCLHICFRAWNGVIPTVADLAARRDSGRLWAVMLSQERKLSRLAHDKARRDKSRHFLQLTHAATEAWHAEGRPAQAICKLRWASRKAAERRAVYAAGGYDIDSQLEEQFRAQEGGRLATPTQVQREYEAWTRNPSLPCVQAVPSLFQLEHLCRRQQASKAPGPDLILNELWRSFPAYAGQWLWRICVHAALSGHEPFHFKIALICALYKKGPAALPQNYRSIALMNGVAKVWHSHLRSTIGQSVLAGYDECQLGGRKGIPVGFAGAAYRCAVELSHLAGRSLAILFVDVQAAYYEASRTLVFQGDSLDAPHTGLDAAHLHLLATELLHTGALELLGVPEEERQLLADCVACSHWRLVSSDRLYVATRGSRPGDGLADIIFGALFSIALKHIRRTCATEGLGHFGSGEIVGNSDDPLQLGWADDLAVLTDFEQPRELQARFPRVAEIVLSTLQALKFRVNLGAGKTEAILDIRGSQAKQVRGELLSGDSQLSLAPDLTLRITPEYRYLGVIQTPRDTGRRDVELSARRACGAWAHGRNLLASPSLPWALKIAWMSGRVLPAAYATLATSLAVSARAWSPLTGFYERAARTVLGSWQFGHILTGPLLGAIFGLTTPAHAAILARTRLVVQLVTKAPPSLKALFDAAWNRSTPWCELLADSLRATAVAVPAASDHVVTSLHYARQQAPAILKACRRLSRWGSFLQAVWDLWQDRSCFPPPAHRHRPSCQPALPSVPMQLPQQACSGSTSTP